MKSILIIDDDALFRGMLKRLLEREGYSVVEAEDGNYGIKRFQQATPDLVVCDMIMPDKEGIETIIAMQKINSGVPIIAVSGGGRAGPESYLPLAKAMGARNCFSKPFDNQEFLEAVSSYM